jgi:hypothetical protein
MAGEQDLLGLGQLDAKFLPKACSPSSSEAANAHASAWSAPCRCIRV